MTKWEELQALIANMEYTAAVHAAYLTTIYERSETDEGSM